MSWALILDGQIAEIDSVNPAGRYVPEWTWVDVSSITPSPEVGWTATVTNGAWSFAGRLETQATTLAQRAQGALGAGLTITSTGTPALNGVYAVDTVALALITSTMLYIQVNGKFPGSSSTLSWGLMTGGVVSFQTTDEFQAFASAVASYVADLSEIMLTGSGTLPAATATIP